MIDSLSGRLVQLIDWLRLPVRPGDVDELNRTDFWHGLLMTLGGGVLVHQQLLEMIDLRRSNLTQFSADELRAEVRSAVERIIAG